ncbi:hypothetical protein [Methanobrevibacter sp. DSM 116169]|uniref:hypothetical protein n=1 Tax=Methanobrevibacter sp. DSM 116169 TaxID=3242727 RepID=UPI0038FBEA12
MQGKNIIIFDTLKGVYDSLEIIVIDHVIKHMAYKNYENATVGSVENDLTGAYINTNKKEFYNFIELNYNVKFHSKI